MKIKNQLQTLFKRFFQFIFKIIYGKIIYNINSSESKNLDIKSIKSDHIKKFSNEDYLINRIFNGRIYTDCVEHVAIIDGNSIVKDASYQQISGELKDASNNIVLEKGTPRIKKKYKGKIFSLAQGASGNNNYFHWMFDILPKIRIFSENYDLNEINYFYAPKLQDWQKKTLVKLDLDEKKFLDCFSNRHIEADQIISVDHPWYHKGTILSQAEFMPNWIITWLKEIYLSCEKKFDNNEKVFIDRSESIYNHCQIINQEEVFDFLSKKKFTKYKVGQLSFEEQIYLFHNAKIIVGPHGAAFTNLIFCQPNTNVIEIMPKANPNKVNKTISKINNLKYQLITTPDLRDDQKINGDIKLNIRDLENALNNI